MSTFTDTRHLSLEVTSNCNLGVFEGEGTPCRASPWHTPQCKNDTSSRSAFGSCPVLHLSIVSRQTKGLQLELR